MQSQAQGVFTPYARVNTSTQTLVAGGLIVLLFGLWVAFSGGLMPSPSETWHAFQRLASTRGLIHELGISLKMVFQATLIATAFSMTLSYSQALPFMRPIVAFVENFRLLSTAGIMFMAMIIVHDGHWVKVFVVTIMLLPFILGSLAASIRSIDDDQLNHARTLKLGHWGTTWEILIRGRFDQVFEAVRQNFAYAWGLTPFVESAVRTEGGIGLLLVEEGKYLRLDGLLAAMIVIFVVGKSQDLILKYLRRTLCPYSVIGTGAL